MKKRRVGMIPAALLSCLMVLANCGSQGAPPDTEITPSDPTATLPADSEVSFVLTNSDALTDIDGHKYEDDIRAVVEAGGWNLSNSATTFAPDSYGKMSDLVSSVLRLNGEYSQAVAYTGGLCPQYPLLSYAIATGILKYSSCPSYTSYPARNLVMKAATRAFRALDDSYEDYYDDTVASYDGPNLGSYSSPYGIERDTFKFAFELGANTAWSSSLSVSSTTYGSSRVTRGEMAAILGRILLHEVEEPTPDPVPTPDPTGYWRPKVGDTWYIQLQGSINMSKPVKIYDIDVFDNSTSTIQSLQSRGVKVVCYFSAGSYENWRPDASKFPSSVKGPSNGWPGENILDIRRLDILGPIMKARMDLAVSKGCDGLDLDNMDVWQHTYSGFGHTYADQIRYNRYMAEAAHERHLAIGLKNDLEQIPDLVDIYDFAINESCYDYNECDDLDEFVANSKAVLGIQYSGSVSSFCPDANARGFSFIRKDYSLGAGGTNIPCWDY